MSTVTVPPSAQPEEAFATRLAESGVLPDAVLRHGIRRLCAQRLRDERGNDADVNGERQRAFIDSLRASAIAIETDAANRQHYELPPQFFTLCLGRRLKYSSCYWDATTPNLDAAEERMLALYGERAELADGQRILELGCGWGSLTLWMAERYPNASITAVSNSRPQRAHSGAVSRARAEQRAGDHCRRQRADPAIGRLRPRGLGGDVRAHAQLPRPARTRRQLAGTGRQAVRAHFCHRDLAYPFEVAGEDNWMGRHFFTGGLMPAADTLLHFQQDVVIEQRWLLSGEHYEKTANAWLENQDRHRDQIMPLLKQTYGDDAQRWWQRWRMFWLACAELFGYDQGREWGVAHYRFVKR